MGRAELARAVRRAAGALARRTPAPGRVAIELAGGRDVLVLGLAAARAGHAALVFDPEWRPATRARVLAETGPDLVVAGGEAPAWTVDGEDDAPPPPDPGALFYVGFTAGSTGTPKGCARTHASWLASFADGAAVAGLGPADRVMALGAFAHSLHLYAAMEALHAGCAFAFLDGFRPRAAHDLARRFRPSVLYGTPAHYLLLAEAAERLALAPLPSVRRLVTGGAKWRETPPAGLRRLLPEAEIVEFYGASETSFVACTRPGEPTPPGSVGRPLPGVGIEVRRADGTPAAAGEDGEIWVRGPQLFDRYVCGADPETRRDGPWLTLGDLGRLDDDGFLFLAGRRARMIVSAAQGVFAEEVEAALRGLPGVGDAVVFGVPDPLRGQAVVAAVRPLAGAALDGDDLRAACRARLEDAKVPRRIVVVGEWPLTSAGKPDTAAIRAAVERATA